MDRRMRKPKFSNVWLHCLLISASLFIISCAPIERSHGVTANGEYLERHDVAVTVVYADLLTISAEARHRGIMTQVNGFYDPFRNELWCPGEMSRTAFKTCGHELCHAVWGRTDEHCHEVYGHH